MDYVAQCLPHEYHSVFQKIVAVESGGNKFAVNVNGRAKLARQPKTREEAISWAKWLIERGYSVDMGLGQVNSQHLRSNGIAGSLTIDQIFDPCTNLKISATIFGKNFQSYGNIGAALSAYNTGSPVNGYRNGYVNKVLNAKPVNWNRHYKPLPNEILVFSEPEKMEKETIKASIENPFVAVKPVQITAMTQPTQLSPLTSLEKKEIKVEPNYMSDEMGINIKKKTPNQTMDALGASL